MTHPTDTESVEWPREIWAAERGEHDPDGRYVLSEHATVPRWEGDRECEFQRYVDGDIYDSADRYWRDRCDALAAERDALEAQLAEAREEGRRSVTMAEAAKVLLDAWLIGAFEDGADAAADDAITDQWAHVDRTYPDAAPVVEAWLRALTDAEQPRSVTVAEAAKYVTSFTVHAGPENDPLPIGYLPQDHPWQAKPSYEASISVRWTGEMPVALRALAGEGRDDG
ncbi:hypothetical protein [Salipiger abyssi]|uniref:hypothetical protein n=1 Tax=Salipiger abyssi TaxID=1250539 RepID=UPI0009771E89|nr:hypothetical protein [Salipiger abyssi]